MKKALKPLALAAVTLALGACASDGTSQHSHPDLMSRIERAERAAAEAQQAAQRAQAAADQAMAAAQASSQQVDRAFKKSQQK
jgi:hypothetical protein